VTTLPTVLPLATASTPPTDAIWWTLFHYYLFFGIAAGVLSIGFMIWATLAHRIRKGQELKPERYAYHPREHNWGNWKLILVLVIITVSVQSFVEYQTFGSSSLVTLPKGDPITIGVVGRQWDWLFVYPNGVNVEGNLTVPQNQVIVLNITSSDVFHAFFIPALSVGKDAVPGHYTTVWFNATQTGTYLIECKELCGVGHAYMLAHLSVVPQASYTEWYSTLGENET
jgi:cytochrome c oxidase subunit 2